MEHRRSYQMLLQHLESYRRLSTIQEQTLREIVHVRYCSEKELYLECGGIAKHICFIYEGYALGYDRSGGQRLLSRIWQASHILLKAESLLAFQRSDMDIIFPEGGSIIEIPYERLLQADELKPFFHYLLSQEVNYYQQQENLFRRHNRSAVIEWFHRYYADVRYRLTEEQIAQFLGITVRWYNKNKNNPSLE